ncbi:hypothetical protein LINGRAHAP2_LOCUS27981 [Linum grandiflorum]
MEYFTSRLDVGLILLLPSVGPHEVQIQGDALCNFASVIQKRITVGFVYFPFPTLWAVHSCRLRSVSVPDFVDKFIVVGKPKFVDRLSGASPVQNLTVVGASSF